MTRSTSPGPATKSPLKVGPPRKSRVLAGGIIGSVVEYYDFAIYGYMAATISTHFFSSGDETAALLGTFAAFAVAFLLRTPGGILFGHIGDKYGRKKALTLSILLMGLATTLIGVLPTYATLGIWATALLALMRCIQGIAAGGEIGGAMSFVAEHAPASRRATHTAFVASGIYFGSMVASLMALALTSIFSAEQVSAWAWRLPFLLSIVAAAIGLWIRNSLEEPEQFSELKESDKTEALPIAAVLRDGWRPTLHICLLLPLITGGYYLASVYSTTYLQKTAGYSPQFSFASSCVALAVGIITLPISGYLGDRFGRKPMLILGALAAAVLGYPVFIMMDSGPSYLAFLGPAILVFCVAITNGVSFVAYCEMLSTRFRYSAMALSNNLTNAVVGGTAPLVAALLASSTGNNLSPSWFYIGCALLTFGGAVVFRETRGIELPK